MLRRFSSLYPNDLDSILVDLEQILMTDFKTEVTIMPNDSSGVIFAQTLTRALSPLYHVNVDVSSTGSVVFSVTREFNLSKDKKKIITEDLGLPTGLQVVGNVKSTLSRSDRDLRKVRQIIMEDLSFVLLEQ